MILELNYNKMILRVLRVMSLLRTTSAREGMEKE